jgi:O-antigen/teichoic acid export membrane protein
MEIKDWFFFSVPLIFTGILAYVLNWTDNFVIGKFLDSTSLGIYGVSYSMSSYLPFIGGFFATLFLPVMTTLYLNDKKNFDKTFKHVVKWVFITNVFFGSVLIYFSKEVLRIFFGPEYVYGWISLSVLASFFVLASIFSFSYVTIMIEKKTSFFFFNNLIFAIVNLILNLILIQKFGIIGVAFASGLTMLLIRLSEFIKSRNKLDLLNFIKISIIGIANIVFIKILFSYVFNKIYFNEILKLIIALGVYSFAFILGLFVFKVFNSEDFELMLIVEKKFGVNLNWIKNILKKFIYN